MRKKQRIKKILQLIGYIWKKNPDFRLMQLLGNPFSQQDLYHLEDNDLEKILKRYYNEI